MLLEQVFTMQQACERIQNSLLNKDQIFYYIIHDKTTVLDGTETKSNHKYCEEHKLDVFYLQTKGGVTILQQGNVSACFVGDQITVDRSMISLLHRFDNFLKGRGLNSHLEDNDLLVDNYKICAFSINYLPQYNWAFASITFTLNIDLDLVQNICNKPMIKIPKGLSEFGITQEEIIENIILKTSEEV